MSHDLRGRVALVTGASRGIGAAIAAALASEGAAVAVNYKSNADKAVALARKLTEGGAHAITVGCDVSKADDVAHMVQRVESELGPIGILVNNAGIAIRRDLDDLSEEDFDQTILVNLKSAFSA